MESIAPEGFISLVLDGGPVLWVLGALSVIALALIVAKCLQFAALRLRRWRDVEAALAAWRGGRQAYALERIEGSREPGAAVVAEVMRALHEGYASTALIREEAERRSLAILNRLRTGFRPLELIGQLSPLLGLLGTVLGMIEAFQRLEAAGSRPDPALLSSGIWQALLTTAAGLLVAIPALFAIAWLESRVERFRQRLEDAVTRTFTHAEPTTAAVDSGSGAETVPRHPRIARAH